MSISGEVDLDNCVGLKDTRGPYETEDACFSRAEEMSDSIKNDELVARYFGSMLGFPPTIYFEYQCKSESVDV